MVAALTATIIVPAKAGLAAEPVTSVANATLPSVALPDMLDPKGEPILTAPQAPDTQAPDADVQPDTTADAVPVVIAGDGHNGRFAATRRPAWSSRDRYGGPMTTTVRRS